MAGESEASFSSSVRKNIREIYEYRCVICLAWFNTTECAYLLDTATQGEPQLRNAVRLGILHEEFERNAEMNGLVQCPNCRAQFTENRIVLSLPIPILKYLEKYVSSRKAVLKPLHEVFDLLVDALDGISVDLPNPAAIIPYIGLFTLVTLDPITSARDQMTTAYLPALSILRKKQFKNAPANTSATAKNVARIFDSLDIQKDTPCSCGPIPLAPGVAGFEEKRYWRIPVFAGAIFAALVARLQYDLSGCEDIRLVERIVGHLMLKSSGGGGPSGGPSGDPSDGSSSHGGGRGGGGGSREGERRQSTRKRKNEGSPSAEKGKMKARRVAGGDRDGDSCESSEPSGDASGKALRLFSVPLWNVGVTPGAPSQYGQSDRLEIASSARDDTPAIDANEDNDSGSETGLSISAIHPPDEDNPAEWQFGPSFSTNKIVFTVRAVKLT